MTTTGRHQTALGKAFDQALQKRSARQIRRKLTLPIPNSHDFSSNDFLSLSLSPMFRTQYLEYLTQQSKDHPQGLASGGSRLLDGNSAFAEDLEKSIARFHDAESALLFNSGYDANVGVFSCIPQPGDIIVYDALIHASIHDGMKLSRASQRIPFPHNSPDGLRTVLSAILEQDVDVKQGLRNVFVAVESVYSMDGDVAPIDKFCDTIQHVLPQRNGYLMVDEAHATGVFGPKGTGVVQGLEQQSRIFLRVHTFGKALASHGAVVLCSQQTRGYLINYARSLIYTTALPFSALASIRTAYEILRSDECDKLRAKLNNLIAYCRNSLFSIEDADENSTHDRSQHRRSITIIHEPSSPIFSIITPLASNLAATCQAQGFMVRAIKPPTVPRGTERVRLCLHSGNTTEAIDSFTVIVKSWVHGQEQIVSRL